MRIVFMGASELGWKCCRAILEMNQQIVGVFSIPRDFKISWSKNAVSNVQYFGFEDIAREASVPLVYYDTSKPVSEYKVLLHQMKPDMLVVIGWYYLLPRSLRDIAPLGAVGIHASLLPKYRGGAPLVWAVINGENRAGVSLFHLEDGVDTGDLIGQREFSIDDTDQIANVLRNATKSSVSLVKKYIPLLENGTAPRIIQDDTESTTFPQREPSDGVIAWKDQSVLQVHNWVRAQSRPYPGAFTYFGNEKVTIWKGAPSNRKSSFLPGELLFGNGEIAKPLGVVCADNGVYDVTEVELIDGRILCGGEFINAFRPAVGSRFGDGFQ